MKTIIQKIRRWAEWFLGLVEPIAPREPEPPPVPTPFEHGFMVIQQHEIPPDVVKAIHEALAKILPVSPPDIGPCNCQRCRVGRLIEKILTGTPSSN